ncbi:MAG: hypothetical protein IJX30_02025 [Clostridia bacterium]|nr:hypothetical protein [Clostridia bacterium]
MEIAAFVLSCVTGVWAIISTFIAFNQNKQIERLKTRLDTGAYISKSKFDVEFECYRNLSRELGIMVRDNSRLYPEGIYRPFSDKEEETMRRIDVFNKAIDSYNNFYSILSENEAFIASELYDKFFEILELCKEQIVLYKEFRIQEDELMLKDCREEFRNCWKRTGTIFAKRRELSKMLREYMATISSEKKELK